MKFRYRGGARGFASRRIGRAVARSVPDDQLGSCFVIAFLLVLLVSSPFLILLLIGIIIAILPSVFALAVIVAVGAGLIFAIKNRYPQKALSWFFLKEDEIDGTVLSWGEIKTRVTEFFITDQNKNSHSE